MLKSNGLSIYSVKRLYDGEIFTIGDFVNDRTISSFSINWMEPGFKVHCDDVGKGNINDGCFFELQYLKKTKQKLFTTEDGVDIFEGDTFYTILKNLTSDCKITEIVATAHSKYTKYLDFSTKEKAEEYVLANKPIFSYNDIEAIITNSSRFRIDLLRRFKEKAKKLMKNK